MIYADFDYIMALEVEVIIISGPYIDLDQKMYGMRNRT